MEENEDNLQSKIRQLLQKEKEYMQERLSNDPRSITHINKNNDEAN